MNQQQVRAQAMRDALAAVNAAGAVHGWTPGLEAARATVTALAMEAILMARPAITPKAFVAAMKKPAARRAALR